MTTQSPRSQSSQVSAHKTPYLRSASSQPVVHQGYGIGIASQPPLESVVIINDANLGDGEWAVGLKECHKAPWHCFQAVFWPCGIAGQVATAMQVPPTFVWLFFAITLLGDVVFTALAWDDAYSDGAKPKFIYNINSYYVAGKPSVSHWSVVGYIFGVLFLCGAWVLRARTQKFYGIKRRILHDLYATLLCTCCSMAQMSKHVEIRTREQQAAQGGRVDVLPAFS